MKKIPKCNPGFHKVYYCLKTGGLRCRRCKILLNDFGNEYTIQKQADTPKYQALKTLCDIYGVPSEIIKGNVDP